MAKLRDVCRHIRSKNAGPFWITVDLFFKDAAAFEAHLHDPALSPDRLAPRFDVRASDIKVIPVPGLSTIKISYPRPQPQGWRGERDMHAGQGYVSLLDLEMSDGASAK
jgi:hypothetical protein